ncbi:MAG: DEAD/DEAH box helicase family protein [Parachlamydiaceae bacterium]|nr:DEAD/DEAH box helicase family protein [Parachlamydiaceae bacterium]
MNNNTSPLQVPKSKNPSLDVEASVAILQPNGVLSQMIPGFESRTVQQHMMRDVLESYNHNRIALIEAGTGTGKSMAYLIPALLWAAKNKERTVISTNTITLQEQLIGKDIPLLTKILKLDVQAVLVKGMSNYVCLRKLDDLQFERMLFSAEEAAEHAKIEAWEHSTKDGSRSDIPFAPSTDMWERVCAEADTCTSRKCPFFEKCHFFRARKQANDAQILVVNHHLLFADLASRMSDDNYEQTSILPTYQRIIIDEAHNIEDIATDYFSARSSHLNFLRTISRLTAEKQGKIQVLKTKIYELYRKDPPKALSGIFNRINTDIAGHKNDVLEQLKSTFQSLEEFVDLSTSRTEEGVKNDKLRLLETQLKHPKWSEECVLQIKRLVGCIERLVVSLNGLERDLVSVYDDRLDEVTKNIRFEIAALSARLADNCVTITNFISDKIPPSVVRWMELQPLRTMTNIHLVNAELNIAPKLAQAIFNKFQTIILCSATLSANRQFNFIRQRLGLNAELCPKRQITEHIYDSPFNFPKQALLAIPTDMPLPTHPDFMKAAVEQIWNIIQASRGNAFVLFTSYSMLRTCHQQLASKLIANRYVVFRQGDESRSALLNRFKLTDRSVLFGTDSFWEGVDVVGEALRCVIIVKLPFKVPSEPIIQARTEAIVAEGGDPFMSYSLPNAIVKFKQGFGRLIRNKSDRGCVVCLDSRLITKGYGQQFLNSLPACQRTFADSNTLQQQMTDFYRKTHYLVKK